MTELDKYRKLAQRLQLKPAGSCQELSEFYFRQLQRLEIDLLLAQIEVTQQQRQIAAIEAKIAVVREDQRQQEGEARKQSSSEEVVGEYACPLKNCGKRFQKQSGVRLHQQLVHSQGLELKERGVFTLQLLQ